MNNIKKMILGFAAVAMIVGGSAFSKLDKHKKATNWYAPLSSTLSTSDPAKNNFSSYNSTPLDIEPGCDEQQFVCAAEFPNTAAAPVQIRYINQ